MPRTGGLSREKVTFCQERAIRFPGVKIASRIKVTCFSNFPLVDTSKTWYTERVKAIIEKYEKKYRGPRLNFLIMLNYVIHR